MTRRLSTVVLGALLLAAAAGAIVVLNVLLLGRASATNDPVGHLSARTHLPAAPAWTVRPTHGEVENDGTDD
ncbi:MAG TPA: hypothetical protein VNC40_04370 [Gaiellaceae bacterium]|nr:hypothetical protein [Gaiellaceae bacterium]